MNTPLQNLESCSTTLPYGNKLIRNGCDCDCSFIWVAESGLTNRQSHPDSKLNCAHALLLLQTRPIFYFINSKIKVHCFLIFSWHSFGTFNVIEATALWIDSITEIVPFESIGTVINIMQTAILLSFVFAWKTSSCTSFRFQGFQINTGPARVNLESRSRMLRRICVAWIQEYFTHFQQFLRHRLGQSSL